MFKIFLIAWKDLQVAFRDRSALILMLAAPLVLTVGFGFVTGAFEDDDGTSGEPKHVLIYNEDVAGERGIGLVELMTSSELADVLLAETVTDVAAARDRVDANEVDALVIIPASFTAEIIPQQGQEAVNDPTPIEIYGNAARPVGTLVVRAIVTRYVRDVEQRVITTKVAIDQLATQGLIEPTQAATLAPDIGNRAGIASGENGSLLTITNEVGEPVTGPTFDLLAYLGPGFAMLFLMFTVSLGGRSFLAEREGGTLPRLLVAPLQPFQVITGKMIGIFLTGVAQLGILFLAFRFMLGLDWGAPLPLILVLLAVVFIATGWGSLLAAFARTPGQVMTYGTGMMMLFGIMSGTFGGPSMIPSWLLPLSRLTPNYWGLDALTDLQLGGTLTDVLPALFWMVGTGLVLLVVANFTFRRQYR
ncbi:MAG: ABC transporter permease [Ardenticatenales bacterium]|nr:ABC transporter permease [Ardenticatenales bacterium]